MSITITVGKAGRLVVPKAIRDNLGLREGSRLRLEVLGSKFEAVPETDDVRIVMKNGFPVIRGGPPLREGISRSRSKRTVKQEQRSSSANRNETSLGFDGDHRRSERGRAKPPSMQEAVISNEAHIHGHAFSEAFSILTGGRLGIRISAADAAGLLRDHVAPRVKVINLTAIELLDSYAEASDRGIRGGAIYDYLHLVAARKAGAARFITLNIADFQSFHRPGDPEIARP